MVDKDGADIGVLGYTNASLPFLIFPINTPPPPPPPPFLEKSCRNWGRKFV